VEIGPSHGIHRTGKVGPVSKIVGHPLVIYRHVPWMPPAGRQDPSLDNQIATYLMIEAGDGFAPPEYVPPRSLVLFLF
jgi:hypothetical protein